MACAAVPCTVDECCMAAAMPPPSTAASCSAFVCPGGYVLDPEKSPRLCKDAVAGYCTTPVCCKAQGLLEKNGMSLKYEAVGDDKMKFTMQFPAVGWISFGLGPVHKKMDVYQASAMAGGMVVIQDMNSNGFKAPEVDAQQDILPGFSGEEKDGSTIISFTRLLDTGDANDSVIKMGELLTVSWAAQGTSDEFNVKHNVMIDEAQIAFIPQVMDVAPIQGQQPDKAIADALSAQSAVDANKPEQGSSLLVPIIIVVAVVAGLGLAALVYHRQKKAAFGDASYIRNYDGMSGVSVQQPPEVFYKNPSVMAARSIVDSRSQTGASTYSKPYDGKSTYSAPYDGKSTYDGKSSSGHSASSHSHKSKRSHHSDAKSSSGRSAHSSSHKSSHSKSHRSTRA